MLTPGISVWADHGDTVSRAYAGTGALKTDFTRTGKRSKEGQLQDGYNSIMRYVRNNFMDGDRQVSCLVDHKVKAYRVAGCIRHPDRSVGGKEGWHTSSIRYPASPHPLGALRAPCVHVY